MRLFAASPPPYAPLPKHIVPVRAAYRIDDTGALCALPQPESARGGLMLVAECAGRTHEGTVRALLSECRRRQLQGVVLPFSAPPLVRALSQPLRESGLALWVSEADGQLAPESRVLISTALSGGELKARLEAACRAFTPARIVLDVERLRMVFPLPCPTGEGTPLTEEALAALCRGRSIFYSRELGARYCTCRQKGRAVFVLFDDSETMAQKLTLGEALSIPRALLTLLESRDVLPTLAARCAGDTLPTQKERA